MISIPNTYKIRYNWLHFMKWHTFKLTFELSYDRKNIILKHKKLEKMTQQWLDISGIW